MTVPEPKIDRSHPSPNRGGYVGQRKVEAIFWHITAGSGASALSWLCSSASQASANYVIMEDGTRYELVPPTESAWANGAVNKPNMGNPVVAATLNAGRNLNTASISIEHAGQTSGGKGGSLTGAQVASTIALTAWLCATFGIAPDRDHIIPHAYVDSVNRPYCPGFSEAEWNGWIGQIATLVHGQTSSTTSGGIIAGGLGKVPVATKQEDDMQLPAPGTAETRIAPDGTPYSVINWGGTAKTILGTNYRDVGVSLIGADGTTAYDRSLQDGAMQDYTARPK